MELHDPYTAQHSRNTVALAGRVAQRLGLTEGDRSEVELVAMLHDVGKIGLPESILCMSAAAMRELERCAGARFCARWVETLGVLASAELAASVERS